MPSRRRPVCSQRGLAAYHQPHERQLLKATDNLNLSLFWLKKTLDFSSAYILSTAGEMGLLSCPMLPVYPIMCNPTGIYGRIFFEGCLLQGCVANPSFLRMTVRDQSGQVTRTESTNLIRPAMSPLQLHHFFRLQSWESCDNLEFHYVQVMNNRSQAIQRKFPFHKVAVWKKVNVVHCETPKASIIGCEPTAWCFIGERRWYEIAARGGARGCGKGVMVVL